MRAIVFSLTLLLSSFLLFLVQPMIGRMILPSLGGAPAVWNGCMLFFQMALLCGYAWAHYGPPKLGLKNHMLIHLLLLGVVSLLLPMRLLDDWAVPSESNPLGWLIGQLTLCVGLPFFVISSSAPLLQRWFAASSVDGDAADEPWFLYAISNVGSLVALLSYPFVFERVLGLNAQGTLWTGGFLLLMLMFAFCAWYTLRNAGSATLDRSELQATAPPLAWKKRLHYIALAAIPSSLMLGVTTIVSTEVGSFPLMWSIPLALYLLTFVFVFAKRQVIPHGWLVKILPLMLLLMPLLMMMDLGKGPLVMIDIHFSTFFIVSMVCHGELARLRPPVGQLTEFYLMMSIGGVVGGALNSLLAPVLFNSILEYPLMLVAACLVLPGSKKMFQPSQGRAGHADSQSTASTFDQLKRRFWFGPLCVVAAVMVAWWFIDFMQLPGSPLRSLIAFGIPVLVCYTMVEYPKRFAAGYAVIALVCPLILSPRNVLCRERGFFGVNSVRMLGDHQYHILVNGRTVHGMQKIDQHNAPQPLTYYHRAGPIGDVFELHGDQQSRIAVVGLGVGSVAAYSKPGQQFDFFEIDPVVAKIANDEQYFSYLSQARGDARVIMGDARIQLENQRRRNNGATPIAFERGSDFNPQDETANRYGLIMLDAFSSDAVPLHLLTKEAVQLYLDLLNDDGLLVVHISSKFMDFRPVAAGLAQHLNLHAIIRTDTPDDKTIVETGRTPSRYLVLSRNQRSVDEFLQADSGWQKLTSPERLLWTDEHANVLDVIMW